MYVSMLIIPKVYKAGLGRHFIELGIDGMANFVEVCQSFNFAMCSINPFDTLIPDAGS